MWLHAVLEAVTLLFIGLPHGELACNPHPTPHPLPRMVS